MVEATNVNSSIVNKPILLDSLANEANQRNSDLLLSQVKSRLEYSSKKMWHLNINFLCQIRTSTSMIKNFPRLQP